MRRRTPETDTARESIQPMARPPTDRTGEVTVIGKGARLEGNLISAGSLRIEGAISGDIKAEGDVELAPGAEVKADIRAQNVKIGSHYSGNIKASGMLELESGARLEGSVTCSSLIINKGAVFSGQSNMDGGPKAEKPSPKEG